jgi:glucose-1-phosphate adenylyltransferase
MKNILGLINLHEDGELLKEIARERPLAAIPFGGRFRIIDFILSNMVNSGIQAVGIVLKQQSRSLMDHLRSGKEWDLARKRDGLFILPPPDHIHYTNSIYKGDLEHFYNQADFIRGSRQDYVLIACSHIIYNFNFYDAYQSHLENRADITVLYKEVQPCPGKSFSQATLVSVGADGWVTDMEVKVGKIAGGTIGLEAFIMSKELLLQIIDDCIAIGEFDLTKEGIIKNIRRYKVRGFPFRGYMAKINSIPDYYQASMELLSQDVCRELFNESGPIYTKVKDEAPVNYREQAIVSNSMVANGCIIEGRVENSLLFRGVRVHKGAIIKNSIIMQQGTVGANATLENVICDKYVTISAGKRLLGDKNYVMVIEKRMVI